MVKNYKLKGSRFALIILIGILIANMQPYYLWNAPIGLIVSLGIFLFVLWDFNCNPLRLFSYFLLFIFYFISSLYTYHVNLTGLFFYGLLPLSFYFINEKNWVYVFKKILLIYSLTLIPSLIVYFLVVWGNVDLPHSIIPPLNELKQHDYYSYPFLVTSDGLESFRFYGYFDEPGVIGTFSGTLFVINKCNLKDWKNWILLISGIVSFSLFFYLLIVIYVFLFSSLKSKLLLAIIMFAFVAVLIGTDNPFNDLIIQRLNFEEMDDLSRLTRTDSDFDNFYNKFVNSDMIWFGYGSTYSEKVANQSGASYKDIIVDHGIIMFIIYIVALFFYYLSYKLKYKQILFLLFIMSANIYQRPFIFALAYIFLLVSPPAVLKMMETEYPKYYN